MKGLKYIFTPKCNIIELKNDAADFNTKLKLIEMFSSEEQEIENEVDISLFTHLKIETPVWTKQLIFYSNKLLKLLAIIN